MKFFSVVIFLAVCCATALSESTEDKLVKFLGEVATDPKKPIYHSQVSRVQCIFSAILDGVRISKVPAVEKQFQQDKETFMRNISSCKSVSMPAICVAKEASKGFEFLHTTLISLSKANHSIFVEAKKDILGQCF